MLNLAEYRQRPAFCRLAALGLVAPGVVLNKDGSFRARVDPQFMQVFARHIKHRPLLDV